jgi:hypothetical protein
VPGSGFRRERELRAASDRRQPRRLALGAHLPKIARPPTSFPAMTATRDAAVTVTLDGNQHFSLCMTT